MDESHLGNKNQMTRLEKQSNPNPVYNFAILVMYVAHGVRYPNDCALNQQRQLDSTKFCAHKKHDTHCTLLTLQATKSNKKQKSACQPNTRICQVFSSRPQAAVEGHCKLR